MRKPRLLIIYEILRSKILLLFLEHRLKITSANYGLFFKLFCQDYYLAKELFETACRNCRSFYQTICHAAKERRCLARIAELIEVSYRNELADSQKAIYLAQLKQMQERVLTSTEEELNRSKMEILSGLMRLRQI